MLDCCLRWKKLAFTGMAGLEDCRCAEMTVKVRVFGYLNQYCDDFGRNERSIPLADHSTANDLLSLLGIPETEDLLLFINQTIHTEKHILLANNDTIWIYPLLCEG